MKTKKVLFVDDEEKVLLSLKRLFFEDDGIEVFTAPGGNEGLKILSSENIDLVVSDQKMPGMSGSEFLSAAKEKYPEVIRIMLTGYADIQSAMDAINKGEIYRFLTKLENDRDLKITIYKALEFAELKKRNQEMGILIKKKNQELTVLNESLEEKVKQRTIQLEKALRHIKRNFHDIVVLLTETFSLSNIYLGGHSKRVAELSKSLGENLNYDKELIEMLYYSSLLHDIGLAGAPDTMFQKNVEDLNESEKKTYLKHPLIGERIIANAYNLKRIASVIRSHHEDYSGGGFPDGLHGEKIPLGARVIRITSDYDSMIFKQGMAPEKALFAIEEKAGIIYDPGISKSFCKISGKSPGKKLGKLKMIKIKDLQAGMLLNKDIFLENGLLLVPKGVILNSSTAAKLSSFSSLLDSEKLMEVIL